MRLLDWMRRENMDDEALASRIGDVTVHAVKKWKYGERTPDLKNILKIEKITRGDVAIRDWANARAEAS